MKNFVLLLVAGVLLQLQGWNNFIILPSKQLNADLRVLAINQTDPVIQKGVTGILLRERGALLIDDFDEDSIDTAKWRIWHNNPDATQFSVENGRFVIRAVGRVRYNGLWSLNPSVIKDAVLVARMDIRTTGIGLHSLLLHLCAGDEPVSPDQWTEVYMVDEGDGKVRFGVNESIQKTTTSKSSGTISKLPLILNRNSDNGFLVRLSINGSLNLCTCEVQDDQGNWKQLSSPIPIYPRTTHCEIKVAGGSSKDSSSLTKSTGWFDNVRIYPRAEAYPVMIRLVTQDGNPIYLKSLRGWPPKIRIGTNPPRSITDLSVELMTADGKNLIAKAEGPQFGSYMLPVNFAGWDVFPVGALIRVTCDGKSLGEVKIPLDGLNGLYPNDVYDVIMQ